MSVAISSGDTDDDDVAFGDRSVDSLVAASVGSVVVGIGHAGGCAVCVAGVSGRDFVAGKDSPVYGCHSLGLAVVR